MLLNINLYKPTNPQGFMGRIHIILDDEVERKFRIKLSRKGYKKGDFSKEIERLIKEDLKRK